MPLGAEAGSLSGMIVGHLVDIMAGRCRITPEMIEGSVDDPEMCEILTGLLYVHQDLQLRDRQVSQRTEELKRTLSEVWAEMDLARKLQTVLLPDAPGLDGYDVAAVMRPALEVGGDYYDFIQTDNATWLLIGDVSGHGVAAGLTMMIVQTAARSLISCGCPDERSPARMLAMLNATLRENIRRLGGQYVTITACRLSDGEVVHAGLHQDILVHRAATNTIEAIPTDGTWIGISDDIGPALVDRRFELASGDTMLLYTDGLTEARRNGKLVEVEVLSREFADLVVTTQSSADLIRRLEERFRDCETDDDVSIVVVRKR